VLIDGVEETIDIPKPVMPEPEILYEPVLIKALVTK